MHVVRQRRRPESRSSGIPGRSRRSFRLAVAGTAAVAIAGIGGGLANATTTPFGLLHVGQTTDHGQVVADDQLIKPLGTRLMTPFGKFMGTTVSPNGKFLAATSTDRGYDIQIFDLSTYKPVALAGTNSASSAASQIAAAGFSGVNYLQISDGSVGQTGPTFSPDGAFLWVPVSTGVVRYSVGSDGTLSAPVKVSIPTVNGKEALTGQVAYSPDGSTLYAAVNGQNTVVAIDPGSGAIKQTWNVGIAPRELRFVGTKLYVSNEGGRQAVAGDTTMNSYGTQVPANGFLGTSTNGTLSVIDTSSPSAAVDSIKVGLHPTTLYAVGSTLYVANTNSDTISVVDTQSNRVVQTIATQPWASAKVGYAPDSIAVVNGHLLVSLGRANAIAVYRVSANPLASARYIGLLPTDYYPSGVFPVGNQIVVANRRGVDARDPSTADAAGHGTHQTTASLTRFTLPSDVQIARYTSQVFAQNGWTNTDVKEANGNARAVPVPSRIGDPSTIKHVFLIVKENRTYDQVFGDVAKGNGDPSLANYGANVTPNQHALAEEFGLYDNFYDPATNSAEGHSWLMQSDDPEYTESSAGEYTRSYDTYNDVLGHQRSGFIWTGVEAAGETARDFGEYQMQSNNKPANATWQNLYCDAKNMAANPSATTAYPMYSDVAIPSLSDISDHAYPGGDLNIPDNYRYQMWKQDFEKNGPANLNMMWMLDDHTGGAPTAPAQVADNDLAVGKIVDTISHSKYWKDSAIFVVEDDSQDGVDHVDGHRAPIQIISPWAKRGVVDDHYYTQVTLMRTIEQILGVQPMNAMDSAATPMTGAFTDKPDYTPFTVVPNKTSLTLGLEKNPPSCGLDTPAPQSANAAPAPTTGQPPANEEAVAKAWDAWKAKQHFTGDHSRIDSAPPEQMSRMDWYQATGWSKPYPGDKKILTPDQVPGAAIPGTDSDG